MLIIIIMTQILSPMLILTPRPLSASTSTPPTSTPVYIYIYIYIVSSLLGECGGGGGVFGGSGGNGGGGGGGRGAEIIQRTIDCITGLFQISVGGGVHYVCASSQVI